jgi:NitT/TauT family transport system ATP-binding protein
MRIAVGRIELDTLAVQYGGFTAVEDVSFGVPNGQFVAVVGPTGCGKSSLLNVVAGLLPPARGSVCTAGKQVDGINHECGYMFQTDALLPWKTAIDNVRLASYARQRG